MIPFAIQAVFLSIGVPYVLPAAFDANGWGLRVERLTKGPYIVGEGCENIRVKITLLNTTGQPRQYPPLDLALQANELRIGLKDPDGRGVRRYFEQDRPTRQEKWLTLEAGKSVSIELSVRDFGFRQLLVPGLYQAQVTFKSAQGEVSSQPWTIDVIKPSMNDILASLVIPLDELEAKRKPDDRYRAFVEQIKLGDRVFLMYRTFWGGTTNGDQPDRCSRLAELSGKVDMKVTGEYGRGKQITIRYEDKSAPNGMRTIVIDSK